MATCKPWAEEGKCVKIIFPDKLDDIENQSSKCEHFMPTRNINRTNYDTFEFFLT